MSNDSSDLLAGARRRLEDLETELGAVSGDITQARRDGDADAWLKLTAREDELPGLIRAAKGEMLAAELEASWAATEKAAAEAERLAAVAAEAVQAAERARTAVTATTPGSDSHADADADLAKALHRTSTAAADADEAARAVMVLLVEVEELETRYVTEARQAAPAGAGLRARPRRVYAGVYLKHPTTGATEFIAADSIPPRWAAWALRDADHIWAKPVVPDRRPAMWQELD